MLYRTFGRTGRMVSALGFGCMRFLSGKGKPTWAERRCRRCGDSLHEAREFGVNYFDTAYNYHAGTSERIVGRFLSEIPRDSVFVASKSPVWKMKKPSDFKRYLTIQLRRLGTGEDRFLPPARARPWVVPEVQGSRRSRIPGCRDPTGQDRACRLLLPRRALRVRPDRRFLRLGLLPDAVQPGGRTQPGRRLCGLRYASSKGMGVAVMEPLRGGRPGERPSRCCEERMG